ncbi:hypothetical protein DENSPDRAFT_886476 [Dentipellis sp. KUC8613]|nr:hypothetical protein DENSPDRAFT_886476 [Dentipellis sp. KUC8613]
MSADIIPLGRCKPLIVDLNDVLLLRSAQLTRRTRQLCHVDVRTSLPTLDTAAPHGRHYDAVSRPSGTLSPHRRPTHTLSAHWHPGDTAARPSDAAWHPNDALSATFAVSRLHTVSHYFAPIALPASSPRTPAAPSLVPSPALARLSRRLVTTPCTLAPPPPTLGCPHAPFATTPRAVVLLHPPRRHCSHSRRRTAPLRRRPPPSFRPRHLRPRRATPSPPPSPPLYALYALSTRCPRAPRPLRHPPPPSPPLSATSSHPPRALHAVDTLHTVPLTPSRAPAGLTAALTRPLPPPHAPARLTAALAALVRPLAALIRPPAVIFHPPAAFFGPDEAVLHPPSPSSPLRRAVCALPPFLWVPGAISGPPPSSPAPCCTLADPRCHCSPPFAPTHHLPPPRCPREDCKNGGFEGYSSLKGPL